MKKLAAVTLGAALCAILSGCAGVGATTTAPPPSTAAAPSTAPAPAAKPDKPHPTTTTEPGITAPTTHTQTCGELLTPNEGNLAAATYLADTCTMDGNTIPLTGPANTPDGRFIQYPNGLTVTLAEVQHMPNSYGSSVGGVPGGLEPAYALVRVDLTITNTGTTPASIASMNVQRDAFTVMYGNGIAAPGNPGIIDANDTLTLVHQNNPPAVVLPGGRADLYASFSVPVTDLPTMSVAVDPDPASAYTPYRMTGLNKTMVDYH